MANKEDTLSIIQKMNSTDLLNYIRFSEIVCDYYDNEMKANTGDYADDTNDAFTAASEKFTKYLNVQRKLFLEVERRIDWIC